MRVFDSFTRSSCRLQVDCGLHGKQATRMGPLTLGYEHATKEQSENYICKADCVGAHASASDSATDPEAGQKGDV